VIVPLASAILPY